MLKIMYILILTKYTKCRDIHDGTCMPYINNETEKSNIRFRKVKKKTNIILSMAGVHVSFWR